MIITPSYSFSRPADTTAYTANDLVANDVDAGDVVPMSFSVTGVGAQGAVRGIRLFKDSETATAASFTIHLFTAAPVVSNGDNGAFAVTTTANYLGTAAIDMSSGALASATDLFKTSAALSWFFKLPTLTSKLYGLIEAEGAYAPASGETFIVTLEIEGMTS